MGTHERRNSDLIDVVKSWFQWRSEPANVSRNFWMPDDSCVVCYECDSQFTVFNRKHHCRKCGRVFCSKCSANFVPVESDDGSSSLGEEGEKVRVCNYCFKQWEESAVAGNDAQEASCLGESSSLSRAGLHRSKSSSRITASVPYFDGVTEKVHYHSAPSLGQYVQLEGMPEEKGDMEVSTSLRRFQDDFMYRFGSNRSDDDDYEYGGYHSDSDTLRFSGRNEYYDQKNFNVEQNDGSKKFHSAGTINDNTDIESSIHDKAQQHAAIAGDKLEGLKDTNNDEVKTSGSIWGVDNMENNWHLWQPPLPEDEDDERESRFSDDEEGDNGDKANKWHDASSSSSFASSEYKHKDRLGEEHKKAMQSIVGGHFRALVAQLLQVENIAVGEGDGKESWLDIITSLSWEAAFLLKPDTSGGGGMDPGLYVKVKCLACGRPSDSMLVKGVVCKKNVAHRRMTSKIEKPRILILGGALEYQRVTNALSSFDTLLQQEMDYLKMAVAKIAAHYPNVLLVEKSVPRFAQEHLLAKNISLVLNIKRSLLERIARCTGAQIVPSIDSLSSPKLGHCDLFHVEKFFEEHGSAGQGGKKLITTLMFFEGCPKPLGYTILLKGASGDELKRIKHVVHYGVFAAYHLALETSFLADEGASLSELPLQSPITVALPDEPSSINRSITTIPGFSMSSTGLSQSGNSLQRSSTSDMNLDPESSDKTHGSGPMVSENCNAQSVDSVFNSDPSSDVNDTPMENHVCAAPSLSLSSKTSADQSVNSSCCPGEMQDEVVFSKENHGIIDCHSLSHDTVTPRGYLGSRETFDTNDPITHDEHNCCSEMMGRQQRCSSDLQYAHQDDARDDQEFAPSSDHRSILVSLSSRCVWKGTVCEQTHLLRIKFYGSFDKPLGRYLRDYLFDQSYRCQYCEMPSEAHVYCYTHRQGSLTISVRKLPDFRLPGERDGKIWMWHRCLRCPPVNGFPPATRRVVMSDAAWGLSFGKFLELSFSNHAAASRVAGCGHSLHRDCLRFYGCGSMVACFRYAPINVNSVYLPPPKLEFLHQNLDWVEKEANEVEDNAELLFTEVLNSLRLIVEQREMADADTSVKVELRKSICQLESMLQEEKTEFEESLQKVTKDGISAKSFIDVLEITKLQRKLLVQSYIWDKRLVFVAYCCNNTHGVISDLVTRNKENAVSTLSINFETLDTSPYSKDSEALNSGQLLAPVGDGLSQYEHTYTNKQNGNVEHDHIHREQSKDHLSTNKIAKGGADALESGLSFRRVTSDTEFKTLVDLSNTLDAKWTGEGGLAAPDGNKLKAVGLPEDAVLMLISEGFDEQCGSDMTVTKLEQIAGILFKLPFSDLYNSLNKISYTLPIYDNWNEYSPKYVHLFKKLMDQGGRRLLFPLGVNDTVIPVYDDEPTSLIAYALVCPDYHLQISDELDTPDSWDSTFPSTKQDLRNISQQQSVDGLSLETTRSTGSLEDSISKSSLVLDPLASTKAMHIKVPFPDDGKVRYSVTCYFSKRFDALRRICCPNELDYIRSISRCKKWGAQGGKSNVFFAKTLDDRFIIKQVTKTELESFIKFAPEYFKYLSESIQTGSPTCLAKILGIYQVTIKYLASGKETRMDLLVMENLLFGRKVTRLYDLKGSSRSRYNADSSGKNKVLLDQNLIEAMPTSPIFVGNKAKRLLERAVWNDTSFLASIDVMDYSLLVGVDEEKHELVLGIIDFMRQYTWDKHLETWVKASGILGGPRNEAPTVISPKQYKKRFRKAMSAYFIVVPDDWSPPTIPSIFRPTSSQERTT